MNPTVIVSLSLALLVGACADDHKDNPTSEPTTDAAATPVNNTDSGVPVSTPADAGTPAIALEDWVNDLVDHHSSDDATPDTVDDKNIADDEKPDAYDARFQ